MTRNPILIIALLALAGCSSMGGRETSPAIDRAAPGTQSQAPSTPSAKGGGYYLDDGPGDNPPANLSEIPDAVPRAEPLLARSNQPYMALGKKYTPMTSYQPYKERGIASWYGKRYHGNKTSSGEVYDMYGMSAAHTTLPIPSYVRVTNPENGKSVVVRVNDRGPFHEDRLIDLSYAAAWKLDLITKGSGLVEVETIDPNSVSPAAAAPAATIPAEQPAAADAAAPSTGLFVQAGAFRQKGNADQLRNQVRQLAQNVGVENWYNDGIYRVRLGPYANRSDAERAAQDIRRALGISTLVITQY